MEDQTRIKTGMDEIGASEVRNITVGDTTITLSNTVITINPSATISYGLYLGEKEFAEVQNLVETDYDDSKVKTQAILNKIGEIMSRYRNF